MIRALAAVLVLAIAGCATPIAAPRIDVFSKAKREAVLMPEPAALPARPHGQQLANPTGDLFAFDTEGAKQLLVRDQVCVVNTQIAAHCAAGFGALDRSYDALLYQAQMLEQQHNYMAERWAQAETELRQRERERAIETWITRTLLAGALLVAAD